MRAALQRVSAAPQARSPSLLTDRIEFHQAVDRVGDVGAASLVRRLGEDAADDASDLALTRLPAEERSGARDICDEAWWIAGAARLDLDVDRALC